MYSYEIAHISSLRTVAPECMVLLKANGSFPLRGPGKIALYGSGARRTIKGGTGSGDVNSRQYSTIEQGLETAGFAITTKLWLDAYDRVYEQAHRNFVEKIKSEAKAAGIPAIFLGMGAVMPEPDYEIELCGEGDTAVYVLSRVSGEGADRKPEKGDFKLTDTEVRDILSLQKQYKRFLLALNVGGVVDLSPVMEVENILLLSQLGVVTGDAFADVLLGKSYPSGKLTTTWTKWEDYASVGDFGNQDDTQYREGIYVGYRYFDSIGKMPLFPFGHGMGYTVFSISEQKVEMDGTAVNISLTVTNTGSLPGKETVQVYVSLPEGKLDQPYQVLATFGKTKELAPKEAECMKLTFPMQQLASFDEERNCSILEEGEYIIWVGTSSRNQQAYARVCLKGEVITKRLSDAGGECGFLDWKPERSVREMDSDAPTLLLSACAFKERKHSTPSMSIDIPNHIQSLSDKELAYLCVGNYRTGAESKSVIGAAGKKVAGAAGETCDRISGIPPLIMADGPAGLRLNQHYGKDAEGIYDVGNPVPTAFSEFLDEDTRKALGMEKQADLAKRKGQIFDQYCTAIPIGTALAQSWNEEVGYICGDLVGEEMERFGIHLWLAPALNIHRNPLCGRNFEYYSEDPILSGKISAAITKGVQNHPGRGVTIKHFCANNQETNRFRSNSAVSRRALRDIYLKGFELCINEAQPAALMTSYNLLNGIHTSERADLLQRILRSEWGFEGLVMTDWITKLSTQVLKYEYASAANSVAAGNELIMPGGQEDVDEIMSAMQAGRISRSHLERCAYNVERAAMKLAGMVSGSSQSTRLQ